MGPSRCHHTFIPRLGGTSSTSVTEVNPAGVYGVKLLPRGSELVRPVVTRRLSPSAP